MTSVQIGRIGVDVPMSNVSEGAWTGDSLSLSGLAEVATLGELTVLRRNLQGLANNPDEPVVPVLVEGAPAGFWLVDAVSWAQGEGSHAGLYRGEWRLDLVRVGSHEQPMVESRLLLAQRPTAAGSTAWQAVPGTATAWACPDNGGVTPSTRDTSTGTVVVYDDSSGGILSDCRITWWQPAAALYDGAATILWGDADPDGDGATTPDTTTFTYTGGTQSYVVPAGITKVRVVAEGGRGGPTWGDPGAGPTTGSIVKCDLNVTPAETLQVRVGGNGGWGQTASRGQSTVGTGGAGGWNGGAAGANATRTGTPSDDVVAGGGGGGGASDVRQGGTALADRVIVAAGGGGQGVHWRGGSAQFSSGSAGQTGKYGGKGGTSSAGGAGGTGNDGTASAGTLGSGGAGMAAPAGVRSGGGGGGGGRYGGGGGYPGGGTSTLWSSGGGSGSSLHTGLNASITGGSTGGRVEITPITAGNYPPPDVGEYRVLVGRDAPASPHAWRLDNGIVQVVPIYSSTLFGLLIRGYDTTHGWHDWIPIYLGRGASYTVHPHPITAAQILRNSPEAVAVRCAAGDVRVDITLRRGASVAEIVNTCWSGALNAIKIPGGGTGTNGATGVLVATTADANGQKWILASGDGTITRDTGEPGIRVGTVGTAWNCAVGVAIDGIDTASTLASRYMAAGGETCRITTA